MKSCLIRIPSEYKNGDKAFVDMLSKLHNTLTGETMSFELLTIGSSIAFIITASEQVIQNVLGLLYAMMPEVEIADMPHDNRIFSYQEVYFTHPDMYSMTTFHELQGDSMSSLLNAMSKVKTTETALLQLVIEPLEDTTWFHIKLKMKRLWIRLKHMFRYKYWFKKISRSTFQQAIDNKVNNSLFAVTMRVGVISDRANVLLKTLISSLQALDKTDYQGLTASKIYTTPTQNKALLARKNSNKYLMTADEIATVYHIPNTKDVPNTIHVLSKKGEPPSNLPTNQEESDEISFFGMTNFHGQEVPFGIRRSDRRRHLYLVDKSGSGKSKLLELLIQSDIRAGKGIGVLDPHGDLVDNILRMVPRDRIQDVIVFDPSDIEYPISFNPIETVPEKLKIRVTVGFIEIFKKLFGGGWNPRLEHVLRYTTLALLDTPNTNMLSIQKMLTDKNYRQMIIKNIKDQVVKNFWVNEFAGWSEQFDATAITPLLNKVGQFISTNMIRNIVGQIDNKVRIRDFMDNEKIFLMKVSKGLLGDENAALLGSMIVTKVYQAAMSRADTLEEDRKDFYFYVDEFQNFATDTFDEILSEARKYRLNLTLGHQFLGQLSDGMRKTVFGNVGSLLTFRTGGDDAKIFEREFNPRFSERDIINLGVREFYLKMTIDGNITEAFSGKTMNMILPKEDYSNECFTYSREHYCLPVAKAMEIIASWEEGKDIEEPVSEGHKPMI